MEWRDILPGDFHLSRCYMNEGGKVGVYMSGWNGGRLMELHLLCCYMRGAGVVPETCLASRTWIKVVSWRY